MFNHYIVTVRQFRQAGYYVDNEENDQTLALTDDVITIDNMLKVLDGQQVSILFKMNWDNLNFSHWLDDWRGMETCIAQFIN